MSAYVPPHRRRQQGGDSSGGVQRQQSQTKNPTSRADDDSEKTPLFSQVFHTIRCINLHHRADRWKSFLSRKRLALGRDAQHVHVQRFIAVYGAEHMTENDETIVCHEWDATQNALYDRHIQPPMIKQMSPGEIGCAMSHVKIWEELVNWKELVILNHDHVIRDSPLHFLVLEDDATFYTGTKHNQQQSDPSSEQRAPFFQAFERLWKILPDDWDMLYFGFSDRGERSMVTPDNSAVLDEEGQNESNLDIWLFRPTYGFHTHAYAIRASAAETLLSQLPVVGPLDVWLADNQWFGLKVYCAVVANEGWKGQGASLISQRKHDTRSDIHQSGRTGG